MERAALIEWLEREMKRHGREAEFARIGGLKSAFACHRGMAMAFERTLSWLDDSEARKEPKQ